MSLKGNAASRKLRGKINKIDAIYLDAYEIAVKHGYKGTVEEWLASLKPVRGLDYWTEEDKAEIKAYIDTLAGATPARLTDVTILASEWKAVAESLFAQVVNIDGATEYSKVDLLPSVEQLAIFHDKDVAFVTENEGGVVTVYAIGVKPTNDYTMQVYITEVAV